MRLLSASSLGHLGGQSHFFGCAYAHDIQAVGYDLPGRIEQAQTCGAKILPGTEHIVGVVVGMQPIRHLAKVVDDVMRLHFARGGGDGFREIGKYAGKFLFTFFDQQIQIGAVQTAGVDVAFFCLSENAAHSGMGILNIVNRVIIRLGFRQVQVEVEMLVGFALRVKEPGRIGPDLLAQFPQCNEFAPPGGHRYLLATSRGGRLPTRQ